MSIIIIILLLSERLLLEDWAEDYCMKRVVLCPILTVLFIVL